MDIVISKQTFESANESSFLSINEGEGATYSN